MPEKVQVTVESLKLKLVRSIFRGLLNFIGLWDVIPIQRYRLYNPNLMIRGNC